MNVDPAWLITGEFSEETAEVQPCSLYRFYDGNGVLLYVGITINPKGRTKGHSRDKEWWREVAFARFEHFESIQEARRAEIEAINAENPRYNQIRPRTQDDYLERWAQTRRVRGVAPPPPPANGRPRTIDDTEQMALLDKQTRRLFQMGASDFIRAWEAREIEESDPRLRYVANLLAAVRVPDGT